MELPDSTNVLNKYRESTVDDPLDFGRPTFLIVHPLSRFRKNWDLVMMVVLLYLAVGLPFRMAFFWDLRSLPWEVSDYALDVFFICDLVLNFNTAYYEAELTSQKNLVCTRKEIAKNYLKGWFTLDFVCSVPVEPLLLLVAIVTGSEMSQSRSAATATKSLKLLRLVRLVRLLRMMSILGDSKLWVGMKYSVREVLKFSVFFLVAAHWLACLLYLIAAMQEFSSNTWTTSIPGLEDGLEHESTGAQYITSLYFAIITMSTIGYGDLTPGSQVEMVFATFSMLMGSSLYTYGVSILSVQIASLSNSKMEFEAEVDQTVDWMQYRKIPQDIQERVINFTDTCNRQVQARFNELYIHSIIPHSISRKITELAKEDILKCIQKHPVLSKLNADYHIMLARAMRSRIYPPQETVYKEGSKPHHMYIIKDGVVEIFDGNMVKKGQKRKGEYFGDVALFSSQVRRESVFSCTYSLLLLLRRSDFNRMLIRFPQIKFLLREDVYQMIADYSAINRQKSFRMRTSSTAGRRTAKNLQDMSVHVKFSEEIQARVKELVGTHYVMQQVTKLTEQVERLEILEHQLRERAIKVCDKQGHTSKARLMRAMQPFSPSTNILFGRHEAEHTKIVHNHKELAMKQSFGSYQLLSTSRKQLRKSRSGLSIVDTTADPKGDNDLVLGTGLEEQARSSVTGTDISLESDAQIMIERAGSSQNRNRFSMDSRLAGNNHDNASSGPDSPSWGRGRDAHMYREFSWDDLLGEGHRFSGVQHQAPSESVASTLGGLSQSDADVDEDIFVDGEDSQDPQQLEERSKSIDHPVYNTTPLMLLRRVGSLEDFDLVPIK